MLGFGFFVDDFDGVSQVLIWSSEVLIDLGCLIKQMCGDGINEFFVGWQFGECFDIFGIEDFFFYEIIQDDEFVVIFGVVDSYFWCCNKVF